MLKRNHRNMKRYLQIGLTLLLTLIVATACHDESEELQEPSMLELIKSGKKKPKMIYSTGEKRARVDAAVIDKEEEEDENHEHLEISLEVDGADLHIHCEGFMENGYLFVQDNDFKVIFTQNIELIDEAHPLDIYIPEAEDYPYYLQIESEKYFAKINIRLE